MSKLTKYMNNAKGIKAFLIGFSFPMGFYLFGLFLRFLIDYNSDFNPAFYTINSFTALFTFVIFRGYKNNSLRGGLIFSLISTIVISIVLKVVYNIGGL